MEILYRFADEQTAEKYNSDRLKTILYGNYQNGRDSLVINGIDNDGNLINHNIAIEKLEKLPLVLRSIPREKTQVRQYNNSRGDAYLGENIDITIYDKNYKILNNSTPLYYSSKVLVYFNYEERDDSRIKKEMVAYTDDGEAREKSNGRITEKRIFPQDYYPYIPGYIENYEQFLESKMLLRAKKLDSDAIRSGASSSRLTKAVCRKEFYYNDLFRMLEVKRKMGDTTFYMSYGYDGEMFDFTTSSSIKFDLLEYFNANEEDTREIIIWSEAKTKTVNFVKDGLMKDIRTRYGMKPNPQEPLPNMVIDSYVPKIVYDSRFNINETYAQSVFPKTAVAISPWFAKMFGVKQMELEQMCKILGYNKDDIRKLMNETKKKKKTLCMIGYGGTGVNTIHWLSEMANMVSATNVFEQVAIFERETAEISNLFRFPIDPMSVSKTAKNRQVDSQSYKELALKINLLGGQLNRLSKLEPIVRSTYYEANDGNIEKRPFHRKKAIIDSNGKKTINEAGDDYVRETTVVEDVIFYGAPGLNTREELSEYGSFISATHGDNGCRLDLNPTQAGETQLQVESYGIIQLNAFFMNQLRMAIGLMEAITDPLFDAKAIDKNIMTYEFTGESKKRTDRNYNFAIENDLILTAETNLEDALEAEAEAIVRG